MSSSGVLFQPASKKQEMFINSDAFVTVYGGAAGCVDADTEFLTPKGWKRISEYEQGDLVAQYLDNGSIQFVRPKEYIKAPSRGLKRLVGQGLDFCLSGEHLVPYWDKKRDKEPKLRFWNDVLREHQELGFGFRGLIKTTFNFNGSGLGLSEGDLRLQVAIQACGAFPNKNKNKFYLALDDKSEYKRILRLLRKWNLPHRNFGLGENKVYRLVVFPKIGKTEFDSRYYDCSQEELKILADEMFFWFNQSGRFKQKVFYDTIDKESADVAQFIFHACGYNTNFYTNGDEYSVELVSNQKGFRSFKSKKEKPVVENFETKDGLQYCFDLEDGMFLARRNGQIFITHNSGKSYMGLMRFLLYVHDPNFFGYVFRLNATDMKGGGGLFQTACRMFQSYDKKVKYTKQPMCIYFPSGATINFTGIDGEESLNSIQGIEISAAMVDEAAQHEENNIFWIISRLRTKAKMIPNIWLTCNPDPDSFLRTWLEGYYLYPLGTYIDGELVEGRPILEKDGDLRWFLRIGDNVVWGDSKEELVEKYEDQFPIDRLSGLTTCQPRSFRFISATCHDNPPLLESDPNYVANLLNLKRIEKERLYYGNWFARQETSTHFQRSWVTMISMHELLANDEIVKRVRAWDLASTLPSEAYPDPDYAAGVLIARTKSGKYLIEDVVHGRWRAGELENMLLEQTRLDVNTYGHRYSGYLPIEPSSAGKIQRQYFAKIFASAGVPMRFFKVGSKKSKLDRFMPFSSAAENGLVYVKIAEWNDIYFSELEAFTGSRQKIHDDQVDSTSDGYNILATTKELPKINAQRLRTR